MILAKDNIDIPNYLHHDPNKQNCYGETVAMILAKQEIMPPKEWMHNYDIKDINDKTLKDYLEDNYLPIPKHW